MGSHLRSSLSFLYTTERRRSDPSVVITGQTGATIRAMRGGSLRRLAAWIGWYEGWQTLRSIAAALRLRSEGHVSGLIKRAEIEFGSDPQLLMALDSALALLRT